MSKHTRIPDWPERLAEYLQSKRYLPIDWGQHDCVLFALGAAEILLKQDFTSEIRGTYSDVVGATRAMRKLFKVSSLPDAADVFAKIQDSEEIPVLMAQRGDIVEAEVIFPGGGSGPALGVVDINGTHGLFVGPKGLITVALKDCRRAWRVG